jgi:hypothetical protein
MTFKPRRRNIVLRLLRLLFGYRDDDPNFMSEDWLEEHRAEAHQDRWGRPYDQ